MRCCRISLLTIVTLFATTAAFAQATSSLRGKVIDAQNAAIPGVTLLLVNEQTGFRREVFSDETGTYQLLQVPPGPYELQADLPGFAQVRTKLTLQVNTPASLDVKMELAGLAEVVQVQAEVATVNTVDASIG